MFLERWELLLPTAGVSVGSAGEMAIDIAVYDELQSSGMFEAMDLDVDEVRTPACRRRDLGLMHVNGVMCS